MVEVLSHGFDERLKVTSAGRRVLRDIPTLLFRSNAAFLAGRVTEILGSDGTSSLHPFPFLVLSSSKILKNILNRFMNRFSDAL
jgi:hypothetical protein